MSDFRAALSRSLNYEGYYANNPADSGGETYRGISRNNHPNWGGWIIIDKIKLKHKSIKTITRAAIAAKDLEPLIFQFYHLHFWTPAMAQMPQVLADWLFDKSILCGSSRAAKMLQRALGIGCDGVIGKITMAEIGLSDMAILLPSLSVVAAEYFHAIVDFRPDNRQFLAGWLRRC